MTKRDIAFLQIGMQSVGLLLDILFGVVSTGFSQIVFALAGATSIYFIYQAIGVIRETNDPNSNLHPGL